MCTAREIFDYADLHNTYSQERDIGHERKRVRNVWDTKNGCGGENGAKGVKSLLLRFPPGPREVLVSEKNYWGDNVRIVWDEFVIEVCTSKNGMNSFD